MFFKFEKEEKVLCFHGPLVYEAKVMKAEFWDASTYGDEAGPHYFVHYKGWKQTWDEWVPESRVLKFNDENLQRQKELQQSYGPAASKKAEEKKKSSDVTATNTKKRVREGATDREEDYIKRPEIRIPLPDSLKARLVDDWEYITKCQRVWKQFISAYTKLVSLPRDPSIATLLGNYRELRLNSKSRDPKPSVEQLDETIEGLKLYFDKALGTLLLYRYERDQYSRVLKRFPGMRMCEIYGAEHLLRLFVQLPSLVAHTSMDKDTVSFLKEQLQHIIRFVDKNNATLLLNEYENAPP